MSKLLDWLLSKPSQDTERTVDIYVEMGQGAVHVGKVSMKRRHLTDAIEGFDRLKFLVFPVAEEEDD